MPPTNGKPADGSPPRASSASCNGSWPAPIAAITTLKRRSRAQRLSWSKSSAARGRPNELRHFERQRRWHAEAHADKGRPNEGESYSADGWPRHAAQFSRHLLWASGRDGEQVNRRRRSIDKRAHGGQRGHSDDVHYRERYRVFIR